MIDQEEILKIARLAHLQFKDAELEQLAMEFSNILNYFDALDKLDTSGIEPMSRATTETTIADTDYRKDETLKSLPREEALAEAPESRQGYFVVPKVIT